MKISLQFIFKIIPRFILVCLGFSLFACAPPEIWETEEEIFRQHLRYGRYGFLRHIDYETADMSQILRLGNGAGLYMHYVFMNLGMPELATEMLRQEWINGEGLSKREAGEILISRLIEGERYDEARREALLYVQDYPDSYAGARLLLEAVYWNRDSGEVLRQIEELEKLFPQETGQDPELLLFRAVSKSRVGNPDWTADLVDLFTGVPASGYHIRAFRYIDADPELIGRLTEEERLLVQTKMWFATANYTEAADGFTLLFEEGSGLLGTGVMIDEAAQAYLYAERYREGERRIGEYTDAGRALPSVIYTSLFARGRLLRAAGDYTGAVEMFGRARKAAGVPEKEDRCLWYELDCSYKQGMDDFLEKLEGASQLWHDPAYFSDLVEEAGAELTAQRRWKDIWRIFLLLEQRGDPEAAARFGYISFRAAEEGLLNLREEQYLRLPGKISGMAEFGYYSLLGEIRSGGTPAVFAAGGGEAPAGEAHSGPEEEEEIALDEYTLFVKGFFSFSLYEKAFFYMKKYEKDLPAGTLMECARLFSDRGYFRESIVAANGVRRRTEEENWDLEFGRLLFPRAYVHEIKMEAGKNNVPWYILAALVREESYFDADAVSRAGAVGLSQLMPATAEDMARRLGIENPDVYDPSANLEIGAYYFGTLVQRFDGNPSRAVFAYNAGPTRMRRWENSFGDLPGDLLLEAVPIEETRNHGRKVLVSALVYGYIYDGEDFTEIVSHYFADKNLGK